MMMNKLHYFVFILFVLFLTGCSSIDGPVRLYDGAEKADNEIVKFIFPVALDVLEFDGKKIKDVPYLPDGLYQLEVLPGKHALKVVYSEVWGGSAMGSLEVSNAFYFKVDTTAGSRYVFKHDAPEDLVYADFDKFVSDIKIWIEEQNSNKKIDAVSVGAYGGFITRFFREDKDKTIDADALQKKAVEQLKFWWKLANEKSRQVFQSWLSEQKEVKLDTEIQALQKKTLVQLKFWWELADEKQRNSFQEWVSIEY